MGRIAFALLCIVAGLYRPTNLQAISKNDLSELSNNEFLWNNQRLQGSWIERQAWDGWFCNGYYKYKIQLSSLVKKIDFDLKDDGFMIATADLSDIQARVDGKYRSKATLCIPSAGWLGASIDWARVKTEVRFGEDPDFKDFRLKIVSTELGQVELGRFFPQWFESFFSGVLNRSLTVVWTSRLGSWISDTLTQVARDKIPKRNR